MRIPTDAEVDHLRWCRSGGCGGDRLREIPQRSVVAAVDEIQCPAFDARQAEVVLDVDRASAVACAGELAGDRFERRRMERPWGYCALGHRVDDRQFRTDIR